MNASERSPIHNKITIGETVYTPIDLHKRFAASVYGQELKQNIRFGPFKPKDVSNTQWVKILGTDVNNLDHHLQAYGITRYQLRQQTLTPSEQSNVLRGVIAHDWPESVEGDTPFHLKTSDHDEREKIAMKVIVRDIFKADHTEKDCDEFTEGVHSVIYDRTTVEGKLFNSGEKIGYMRTGLRAYDQHDSVNGQLSKNLKNMGLTVPLSHTPFMLEASLEDPSVRLFIASNEQRLTRSVDLAARDTVSQPGKLPAIAVKELWDEYKVKELGMSVPRTIFAAK